ncbi:MAG: response regulator [Magnetococcales bacterium]|nr:response regulator [Magnetococcales bacterium]
MSNPIVQAPLPLYRRLSLKIRFLLLFYLVTVPSLGVTWYYGYSSAADAFRSRAAMAVEGDVYQTSQKISDFLLLTHSNLNFFANHVSLLRQMYWSDMHDQKKYNEWHSSVLDTWQDLMRSYDYLYRVRFLGADGQEIISIRRDPVTRQVVYRPSHQQRDERDEPFFKMAWPLDRFEHAVTSVVLSRDQGRVEVPSIPVVTLTSPVVGDNKVKYGVLVLDLFGESIFQYIREANGQGEKKEFYLIDLDGSYFFHYDPSKSVDHRLESGSNFRDSFPETMEALEKNSEGTVSSLGQIFGFKRIFPRPADRRHYWILVSAIPESVVLGPLKDFKTMAVGMVLIALILVFVVSHYYVRNLMRPLHFVTRQLRSLSEGRIEQETFPYRFQDEIRQMLDSTERLLSNLSAMAAQANTIARGDLSQDVVLLSQEDRLGEALNHMTIMLRQGEEENRRRNWIRDGINQLTQRLTGDLTSQELVERALSMIGDALKMGRGVFYLYDAEAQVLELMGSYRFTQRRHLANRIRVGEGAVGQVARERKTIILVLPDDTDPAMIATGTTVLPAQYTVVHPLLREGELLGVMELNGMAPMDPVQREFLEGAADVVVSLLLMAIQRQRINLLFARAEEARKLAQDQAEELVRANTNLKEQQQRLQQQTEELQQSNAQLEEQQQQLQQQAEELQQTNAQMEQQRELLQQQAMELKVKNDDLMRSQTELDDRAKMLEESNRYKSEFLANMSHELRTPLNSIIVLSKMLSANEHHDLDEESIKQARVINDAGNELLRLINDILDLSKIEAGRVEVQWERFAVADLLSDFQDLFAANAREKGVEFIVEDRYGGDLNSDRHKLSQVIRNLLANAFKFTRQGRVSLTALAEERVNDTLLIQVADTGIGIPADKHQLIFEEFQQVDGTISREFGGTGLGLSISRRLVGLLGGEITLESVEGQGTTFTVRLPLKGTVREEVAPPSRSKQTAPSKVSKAVVADDRAQLSSGERHVLVIDDDPTFCETVIQLNRRLGIRTVVALTGNEGLELALSHLPSGIILDLGLPDMNGMLVLNQLKANRVLNSVPVYIITGKEEGVPWKEGGAIGFLRKPVDAERLAQVVNHLAPNPSTATRILLVLGPDQHQHDQSLDGIMGAAGLQVVRVEDAQAALAAVQNQGDSPFAVVICDYHLPGGLICTDFFSRLRAIHPGLRCIVLNDEPLSEEQLLAVRTFTDSIIQQAPRASGRLLTDVERFLREIPQGLGETGQPAVNQLNALAGRTILVADDDPRNLYVITAALERNGARVVSAMNGKKALHVLGSEVIDLVLMDIMMPEMNGYQSIEAIRADDKLKTIPIIALTAKAMKTDREKCLAAGADDYISKPVDYDVLINMVKAWSSKRR